jgi:hypothetical protein
MARRRNGKINKLPNVNAMNPTDRSTPTPKTRPTPRLIQLDIGRNTKAYRTKNPAPASRNIRD